METQAKEHVLSPLADASVTLTTKYADKSYWSSFPLPVLEFDSKGCLLNLNRAAAQLYEGTVNGIEGLTLDTLANDDITAAEGLNEISGKALSELLAGQTSRCSSKLITKSQRCVWLLSEIWKEETGDPNSSRTFALQLDVSQLREREMRLESSEITLAEQLNTLQRKVMRVVADNDVLKSLLQDSSAIIKRLADQVRGLGQRPLLETDWESRVDHGLGDWSSEAISDMDSIMEGGEGFVSTGIVSFLAGAAQASCCSSEGSRSPRTSMDFMLPPPRAPQPSPPSSRGPRSSDRSSRDLKTLNSMKRSTPRSLTELPTVLERDFEWGCSSHPVFMVEEEGEQAEQDEEEGAGRGGGSRSHAALVAELNAALADAKDVRSQLEGLHSHHAELQGCHSVLAAELSTLRTLYTQLSTDTIAWKQSAESERAQCQKLQAAVEELRLALDTQQEEHQALQAKATHLKAAYDTQETRTAAVQQAYEKLESDTSKLRQAYEAQRAHVAALESEAVDMKLRMETQKASYDKLELDAAGLKAAYELQKGQYDRLEGDSAELKAAYESQKRRYDDLQGHVDSIKQQYDAQRSEYERLQGNACELKQAYDMQQAQFQRLEGDASQLKEAYDSQKAKCDKLRSANREMKANLEKVVEDSSQLKAEFDSLAGTTEAEKQKLLMDQAEKELQLELHKKELEEQRVMAEKLMSERNQLLRKQEALRAELVLAMGSYQPKNAIDAGTPAERILGMMSELLDGCIPSIEDILFIQTSILESSDIYKPPNLNEQLMNTNLDNDVSQMLGRSLGVDTSGGRGSSSSILSLEDLCNNRSNGQTGRLRLDATTGDTEDYDTLEQAVYNLMGLHNKEETQFPRTGSPKADSPHKTSSHPAPPRQVLFEQTEMVLRTVGDWQFNAFALAQVTDGHPLSVLSFFLFHQRELLSKFAINPAAFARYARRIEEGYKINPYHNAMHAADVLQTVHVLLHQGGLVPGYADGLTVMAVYFAAMVHDFEHIGLTNDYLITTGQELAIIYNDRSPQENHHLAAAFRLLRNPDLNFLSGLKKADMDKFRKLVIDIVMATDMKQHFTTVSQFSTVHRISSVSSAASSVDGSRRSGDSSTSGRSINPRGCSLDGDDSSDKILIPVDENERLLTLQLALKCADLGHVAADWEVHKLWVARLEDEFFRQGDQERELKIPISPLFDRYKQGITKSQVGFFEIVVIPLYTAFSRIFVPARPLLKSVMHNYNAWVEVERGKKGGA